MEALRKNEINWGILGCARIAERALVPAFRQASRAVLHGIASRDEGRAREWAARFGFRRSYPSYGALLEDPEVDAVYVPLPNDLHAEWAIRAASAGKHVLCEKPLALNEAEVRKMLEAARVSGVLLLEAFMYRFHPQFEKTMSLVRDGTVGEIRSFRSAFTFHLTSGEEDYRWRANAGGGALYDVGCYAVNAARTVFGEEPVLVYARSRLHPKFGVDSSTSLLLEFPGARCALLEGAFDAQFQSYFEIVGTEGKISLPRSFSARGTDVSIHVSRRDKTETISVPAANEYARMVDHFGDCLRNGRPLRYSADDAIGNARVIGAAFESVRIGGPVSLTSPATR